MVVSVSVCGAVFFRFSQSRDGLILEEKKRVEVSEDSINYCCICRHTPSIIVFALRAEIDVKLEQLKSMESKLTNKELELRQVGIVVPRPSLWPQYLGMGGHSSQAFSLAPVFGDGWP